MGLFIEKPTPFIPEFLTRMMQLDYPKKRIDLLVHNTVSAVCITKRLFSEKLYNTAGYFYESILFLSY